MLPIDIDAYLFEKDSEEAGTGFLDTKLNLMFGFVPDHEFGEVTGRVVVWELEDGRGHV